MTCLAWLVIAAGSLGAGCGGTTESMDTESSRSAGGAGGGGVAGEAGTTVPADPPIPADDCRWEGYGIGSAGLSQCDTQHLLVHAQMQCFGVGGRADGMRTFPVECPAEALEVQVYCCYKDHLPSAADTPVAMTSGPMTGRVTPAPGEDSSRAAVLARAAASCVVGDWNALYAADGASVEVLRFGCK